LPVHGEDGADLFEKLASHLLDLVSLRRAEIRPGPREQVEDDQLLFTELLADMAGLREGAARIP
jgi:hypothetical protein